MSLLRAGFPAIGTTALVVALDPHDLVAARRVLDEVLVEVDEACSRFRADSELSRLQSHAGTVLPVGPMLWDALQAAARAATVTGGLVDATVGTALVELGYDRDFADMAAADPTGDEALATARAAPGWEAAVTMDPARRTACVAPGTVLDLGATAKALAVDVAAAEAGRHCTGPVLLSVGGDLAVVGPAPAEGWVVRIAASHLAGPDDQGTSVVLRDGALATSAPSVRAWGPPGARRHHIVDPRTGRPAREVWQSVSVAAAHCVDANIASTAAVLLGEDAPGWLATLGLPSLLFRPDGSAVTTGGWPAEAAA